MPLAKISENIKNGPKNLKNVSSENLGKNKELPALGKSQRKCHTLNSELFWTLIQHKAQVQNVQSVA